MSRLLVESRSTLAYLVEQISTIEGMSDLEEVVRVEVETVDDVFYHGLGR